MATLNFETNQSKQIVDITKNVEEVVKEQGVQEGICLVFGKHTTCSVILGEYESGLSLDFLNMFEQLKPKGPFNHAHEPNHAPSHLFSSTVGEEVTIPIQKGRLDLGTWQRILLVEFDGPRTRNITIKIIKG